MDLGHLARGVLHYPAAAPAPRPRAGDTGTWLCLAPAGSSPPGRALVLPAGAEYAVSPAGESLGFVGTTPRALLASVYALLQAAGCRWSPLGAEDEHVPAPGEATTRLLTIVSRPAFMRRAY